MLFPQQAHRLLQLALAEFAPDWEIAGGAVELSLHNPEHWVSGVGTFGLVLRQRGGARARVLGFRMGQVHEATYHRGISYRVLEAYADRITDPIRRYFEEIGIIGLSPERPANLSGRAAGSSARFS